MGFWKKRLYADAAAATPLSRSAERELLRLLPLFGNPGALHREALDAKHELERARKTTAGALSAHADEIVFTSSGTEANNLGVQGVLRPLLQTHGKLHAITSSIEHQSVLEPLRALKSEGLSVTYLKVDREGFVDPKALRKAIIKKTVFVSVQMVNSEVGVIQPIREFAKEIRHVRKLRGTPHARVLRAARPSPTLALGSVAPLPLYFHTDACQAPLWLPLAAPKLGIDLMTLDGQKMMGPKGVGALYVKRGTGIEPILWGGKQEGGLRGGTENVAVAGAFAVALKEAQERVEERVKKVAAVRDFLWSEVRRLVPNAILNGPPSGDTRVANNLNISIPGLSAEMAVVALDAEGIAASTRSACTVGEEGPSHVIVALGIPKNLANTAIRITLLPDATSTDARRVAKTLANIARKYGNVL